MGHRAGRDRHQRIAIPVTFDAEIWKAEVERIQAARTRGSAEKARREIEKERGVVLARLRDCEEVGPEGAQLGGCVKLYLPQQESAPSQQPHAFVFDVTRDENGRLTLMFLAFGERHPERGTRSVYERAHKQLHGRFPERPNR